MLVLGIDVGSKGAIAVIESDTGDLIEVYDMPTLQDGPSNRAAVNPPLLADIVFKSHAKAAFVEMVNARPGEAASGAFAFGRCRGVIEGVLGAAGIPSTQITPSSWKRAIGIPPGKDGTKDLARSEAIRRWPGKADLFARKRDDGRAESALIAVAGLMKAHQKAA